MIYINDYIISIQIYMYIGLIVSFLLTLYFLYIDYKNDELSLSLVVIIRDISEGLSLGMSWIFSIPIASITNIILGIIICIYSKKYKKEDDD